MRRHTKKTTKRINIFICGDFFFDKQISFENMFTSLGVTINTKNDFYVPNLSVLVITPRRLVWDVITHPCLAELLPEFRDGFMKTESCYDVNFIVIGGSDDKVGIMTTRFI